MSQANPDPMLPPVLPRCTQCGAHLQPTMPRCWLCYADVAGSGASGTGTSGTGTPSTGASGTGATEWAQVEVASPPKFSKASEVLFQIVSAALALVLLLTAVGVFMEDAAMGAVFLFFVLLPLGVTFIRVHNQRQRFGAVSWAEKLGTFIVSTALIVGLAGVVMVAGTIAIIVICIASMGQGGFH